MFNLPYTDFHTYRDNPVFIKLKGRIPLTRAFSLLHFKKKGLVQNLLHELKYHKNEDIGLSLGARLGMIIQKSIRGTYDYLMPVPIHPVKLKKRGYNQSEIIAKGLATKLNTEINSAHLIRKFEGKSQTKKGRIDRWKNVYNQFQLNDAQIIKGKKILLVDDVMTTGATLEACGDLLIRAGIKELSVAVLANAQK
ncbi:MAG: phosphoribosyltransferase family protein [Cyclobacteriaceae bacterium]|nr:phosphoribosyltransferase family protein [Cyclobacteriaceae bacterium]